MEIEEGAPRDEPAGQEEAGRRTGRTIAAAALIAAVGVLVAIVLLDLWVQRSSAERTFIESNVACLRCHTELLARLDDASVHEPFLRSACTSCHTVHGDRRTTLIKAGDFGAWRWLELTLDQIALRFVWRILSGPGLVAETGPSADSSTTADGIGTTVLRTAEDRLCWTCHGDLGPELYAPIVHAPFEEGRCTSCHDGHSSDTAMLLKGETEDLCVSCHRIGPELLASEVHLPFGERRCVACHRPHSSEYAGMLTSSQRDLCFGCHPSVARLVGDAVQHEPFATGDCTGCHKPHAADASPLLIEAPPQLCYGCHADVEPQFTLASAHPVPDRLRCADCHMPHASGFTGLLPVAQRELCIGCHDTVRQDLKRPVIHEPVAEDVCTSCHAPHGSNAAPMLQASTPALCYRCHPDKPPRTIPSRTVRAATSGGAASYRGRHARVSEKAAMSIPQSEYGPGRPKGSDPITLPYRGTIRLPSIPSHTLGQGADACSTCHRGHSSDNETLFVRSGNALCAGCHGAASASFTSSAHGRVRCATCHSLHTPGYAPLLVKGNPEVCLRCHPFAGESNVHPASPDYYDTYANAPLTCTSTCHNPHGSRYASMLRLPYFTRDAGGDYICLVCHRQVGVTY